MMKRMIALLLIGCAFISFMPVAMAAEGNVTVSFAKADGATNVGYGYAVTVRSNKATTEDLTVFIACKDREDLAEGVIPAGEKKADIQLPAAWLEEKAVLSMTIAEGEGYVARKNDKHRLQVYEMPVVQLEKSPFFGFLGKKLTYKVKVNKPGAIVKGNNVYQLRNQNGLVLAEKAFTPGQKDQAFVIDITEEMMGKNLVSVWLGDQCISDREGYIAVDNPSVPVVKKVDTQAPYMAITVDCAYAVHHTDRLLQVLDDNDVKITFFMTGYFLREFEESARKIESRGHEIASHTNTHPRMTQEAPYEMMRQIQRPAEDIRAMFGKETTLMRPPFGDVNRNVTAMARAEGQEVIMWTIDSHDWDWDYSHEDVVKRVTKDVGPGTIILFHLDGFWTPDVLAEMLPYYQEELGLKVVTVTELMSLEGAGPDVRLPVDDGADKEI